MIDLIECLIASGIAIAVGLGGYLLWTHWSALLHEVAAWARKRNYPTVIRVLCLIEDVRAGLRRVVMHYLGTDKDAQMKDLELITVREIGEPDLPEEFRKLGAYVLEINTREMTHELS